MQIIHQPTRSNVLFIMIDKEFRKEQTVKRIIFYLAATHQTSQV